MSEFIPYLIAGFVMFGAGLITGIRLERDEQQKREEAARYELEADRG